MKTFLAAGDVLINPALLAFAAVETDSDGVRLRLRFTGPGEEGGAEVRLEGLEARSVLRWLRTHSEFLDAGQPAFRPERRAGSRSFEPERKSTVGCSRGGERIAVPV